MKQYKYIGTTARGDLQVAWTRDIRHILASPSNGDNSEGRPAGQSGHGSHSEGQHVALSGIHFLQAAASSRKA